MSSAPRPPRTAKRAPGHIYYTLKENEYLITQDRLKAKRPKTQKNTELQGLKRVSKASRIAATEVPGEKFELWDRYNIYLPSGDRTKQTARKTLNSRAPVRCPKTGQFHTVI